MRRRVHLVIHGWVQGVFFRASTRDAATQRGLTGWVRNLPSGAVECVAEGDEAPLRDLVSWCHHGPRGAQVDRVDETWSDARDEFNSFSVSY